MKTYIYDGSFEGLLTCFYYIFFNKDWNCIISSSNNMLFNSAIIKFEEDKYEKVVKSIKYKISKKTLSNIYITFLSNDENKERYILNYIKLGFKIGKTIDEYLTKEEVSILDKINARVMHESHKFKGFIRFRELVDKTFYSIIEPDHNILPIIARHFKNRFADQNWVIHDNKRDLALIYNKTELKYVEIKNKNINLIDNESEKFLSKEEILYQNLWKNYFTSIAIKERTNKKLQKQFVPKKYWKFLIEKIK